MVFQVFYCLIGGQTGPQMCWAKPPDLYRHTFHIKSLGKQPARASNDKNGQPTIKNQTWARLWEQTKFIWPFLITDLFYTVTVCVPNYSYGASVCDLLGED
jgi:hypothetical protein